MINLVVVNRILQHALRTKWPKIYGIVLGNI